MMTPECMDSNTQLGKAREKSFLTQRAAFPPQGTLSGDIVGCHNGGCREECSGIQGVKIVDTDKPPTMHRTASYSKELVSLEGQWCQI